MKLSSDEATRFHFWNSFSLQSTAQFFDVLAEKPSWIYWHPTSQEKLDKTMSEPQIIAVGERASVIAGWMSALSHAAGILVARAGSWATKTSQQFGSVVSALMGPAIVSAYALAFWSLSSNIGWTGAFMVTSGPLSNWMVWVGIAVILHIAAALLRRQSGRS
jgi:hypothetical protein